MVSLAFQTGLLTHQGTAHRKQRPELRARGTRGPQAISRVRWLHSSHVTTHSLVADRVIVPSDGPWPTAGPVQCSRSCSGWDAAWPTYFRSHDRGRTTSTTTDCCRGRCPPDLGESRPTRPAYRAQIVHHGAEQTGHATSRSPVATQLHSVPLRLGVRTCLPPPLTMPRPIGDTSGISSRSVTRVRIRCTDGAQRRLVHGL
jgi:hypothetical protein